MRQMALKRFLNACKQRHALAFFQWRAHKDIFSRRSLISAVFATRIEMLRLRKEVRETILGGKLTKELQIQILAKVTNP